MKRCRAVRLGSEHPAAALDRWLASERPKRESLNPAEGPPTSFETLFLTSVLGEERRRVLVWGCEEIVAAVLTHYPDNIFWDFDRLFEELARRVAVEEIETSVGQVVGLMGGFGGRSPIRFRYIHDFIYGFDWAKWVARAPEQRRHIGPFDGAFLTYLERRREELLALIAADDSTYGRLLDERSRNPFGFSREPSDERLLHRRLAFEGQIPVEAWRRQGVARWGAHYAERRADLAQELGL